MHQSLAALDQSLRSVGSRLILRQGSTLETLLELARKTGAREVVWNRLYEPAVMDRDAKVEAGLRAAGLTAGSHNGSLLFEPWEIQNKQASAVPGLHAVLEALHEFAGAGPAPACTPVAGCSQILACFLMLAAFELMPRIDWAGGLRESWTPGEKGAAQRLEAFVDDGVEQYASERNRPDRRGSSMLSAHLHHGEISPRQVWHRVCAWAGSSTGQASVKWGRGRPST